MTLWFGILAASVASYGLKVSVIALGDRVRVPQIVDRAGTFTAPALMTALAVRSLVHLPTTGASGGPVVLGALAGAATAARTRSIRWTLAVGLAVATAASKVAGA